MEVLNTLALPQSTEHFHLLLVVYNIVTVLLIPYLALVVGGFVMAVWMDRRARRTGDPLSGALARRLTGIALPSKSTFAFLALLPMSVVTFLFIQIFQSTPAASAGYSALASFFVLAGGIAGFAFKYTFTVDDVIAMAEAPGNKSAEHGTVDDFVASTRSVHRRAGLWGAVFFLVGAFLYIAAATMGVNEEQWRLVNGLFSLIVSGDVWLSMLEFLAGSAAMAGAGLLFGRYVWGHDAGIDIAEETPLRTTGVRLAVGGILALPMFSILSAGLLSSPSLSGMVYAALALAVLALGLALLFLYAFVQSGKRLYISLLMLMVIVALGLGVTRGRIALHTVTADHAAQLAGVYDQQTEQLRTSLGVGAKNLSGLDIYNGKCSACHLFDQKKVGPPYNVVIPKYASKKAALVAFVLNPVKVDPAFPSMPAQGLRPAEADSIATYLLMKVTGKAQ
jgi:cytochrome c